MDYLSTQTDADQSLRQIFPLHAEIPFPRSIQPDLRSFASTHFPEHRTTINHPIGNIEASLPPLLPSSLNYTPTVASSAGGFEAPRFTRPPEHIGDYLRHDLRMPPLYGIYYPLLPFQATPFTPGFVPQSFRDISGIAGLDFGEFQDIGRNRTAPRLLDLSSPSDPLRLYIQTALPSNADPLFNISSSSNLSSINTSPSGDTVGTHFSTALPPTTDPLFNISSSSNLSSLNTSPSCDTVGTRLPTASSFSSSNPSLLGDPPFVDPFGLHLLTASSSSNSSPFPLDTLVSSDPLEFHLTTASSSGSHSFFDIASHNLSQFDISPSGDTIDLNLLATSSLDHSDSLSLDVPSSPGPPLQPHDASPASINASVIIRTENTSDLTSDHNLPPNSTVAPVQAAPENPQDTDSGNPTSSLPFVKQSEGGGYECSWSRGGDRVCGYRGRRTQVRRHVDRVHLEIKYASNFSVVSTTNANDAAGIIDAMCVKGDSTTNLT